jgi:cardiolipin synthase
MPPWLNLPNFFTFIRLALTPWVVHEILAGRHGAALFWFIAAAVTDLLDGAAARKLGLGTQVGAYFDPIADKCLMSGVFLALAAAAIVPWWLVFLVLGRDIYILAGAAIVWKVKQVKKFPPSLWGKLSTFFQIATVVVWLTSNAAGAAWLHGLAVVMLWVCAAFTAASGLHYTWRGIQIARAD